MKEPTPGFRFVKRSSGKCTEIPNQQLGFQISDDEKKARDKNFTVEEEIEWLMDAKQLINSHFQKKNNKGFADLEKELNDFKLECIPTRSGKGYNLYEAISEVTKIGDVMYLCQKLCEHITASLDFYEVNLVYMFE